MLGMVGMAGCTRQWLHLVSNKFPFNLLNVFVTVRSPCFILNFCHSAMSIFGFGALQIGCFSTKMQHLLPWAPLLLPILLHPQLQAPSHPIPSHRQLVSLCISFLALVQIAVLARQKELMSRCFSGCFSRRRNPKSYSLCHRGAGDGDS